MITGIIGFIVGLFAGVLVTSLCAAARDSDRRGEEEG